MGHNTIKVIAPGRVCLYGEHQDYLGLPVIAAAVDLYTAITCTPVDRRVIRVISENVPETDEFRLDHTVVAGNGPYKYIRAVAALLKEEHDWQPDYGLEIRIKSNVPVGSGLSSSAALLVSFTGLVNAQYQLGLDRKKIAEISYQAEHRICSIECGRMDQYASALGGLIFLETGENPHYRQFTCPFPCLVIGDTRERRKADDILYQRKRELDNAKQKLGIENYHAIQLEDIKKNRLNALEFKRLKCVLKIRDITRKAVNKLEADTFELEYFGQLLTDQHIQLRDNFDVSSKKLDVLVEAAISNGALGAKLTGAGLAGCIVAATETAAKQKSVAEAIKRVGGKSYEVCVADGMTLVK